MPFGVFGGGPGAHFGGPGRVQEGVLGVILLLFVAKPTKTKMGKTRSPLFFRFLSENGPNMAAQKPPKFHKMGSEGLRERFLWVLIKDFST